MLIFKRSDIGISFRHISEVRGNTSEFFTDHPFLSSGDPDNNYTLPIRTIVQDLHGAETEVLYNITVILNASFDLQACIVRKSIFYTINL